MNWKEKTTKQEAIERHLAKEIDIGDEGYINLPYTYKVSKKVKQGRRNVVVEEELCSVFTDNCTVIGFVGNDIIVEKTGYTRVPSELKLLTHGGYNKYVIKRNQYKHSTYDIGAYPFEKDSFWSQIRFTSKDIQGLLFILGYERREKKFRLNDMHEAQVPETSWNPYVIGSNGDKIFYQRPFVWTLEEKQLLIESIYHHLEIGKFIFRKRSWKYVETKAKEGDIEGLGFNDIVDGKQRANTILGFLQNEFPDKQGNYWDDLSNKAQGKFYNFSNLTIGELGEAATDKDTLKTFLNVNFTGAPMSQEHIDYVKSIRL